MRILELADSEAFDRNANRSDNVGAMLRRVREAADPDEEFQRIVRDAGIFRTIQIERRRQIMRFATAFGVSKALMKQYLLGAGLVNETD